MKLGSVQFFKRMIVTVLLVLIIVPTILAILFGVLYSKQKNRADWLETVNWAMMNSAELPEGIETTDDFTKYLQNKPADFVITPSFEYQILYPDLYFTRPSQILEPEKVCYLTFDDGPSPVTMQILKVLRDYNIKGTFFVTGPNSVENEETLRLAAQEGHTIGVHTWSHEYEEIYQSVDAYLADFEKMQTRVQEVTGTSSGIFRFPGGSINAYNKDTYEQIIAEMIRRGYTFYDWNVAANDAVKGGVPRQEIIDNVVNGAQGKNKIVVLMHDRHENATTAAALPGIIEKLAAQGYTFAPLSAEITPITYFYQG